jgi:hypothetical protein
MWRNTGHDWEGAAERGHWAAIVHQPILRWLMLSGARVTARSAVYGMNARMKK